MLRSGKAGGCRAYAILAALHEREITLREFAEAVEPLAAEEVQVIATLLFDFDETAGDAVRAAARSCCLRWASEHRVLC